MTKLNICHIFATELVLIRSQRQKREKTNKKEEEGWIRHLFADKAASGAY